MIKQSKTSSHAARHWCMVQVKLTGVASQKYWCYALGGRVTGTSVWTSLQNWGCSSTGTGHIVGRDITQTTAQGRQVGLALSQHEQGGWPDLMCTHTNRHTNLEQVRETCQSLPKPAQHSLLHSLSPSPHYTHSYTDCSTVHPRPSPFAQLWCQPQPGHSVYLI